MHGYIGFWAVTEYSSSDAPNSFSLLLSILYIPQTKLKSAQTYKVQWYCFFHYSILLDKWQMNLVTVTDFLIKLVQCTVILPLQFWGIQWLPQVHWFYSTFTLLVYLDIIYLWCILLINAFFTVSKILVSTGYPRDISIRTEIINLENNEVTCQDLEKYPMQIEGAVGANLGSSPVICPDDKCQRLVAGEWQQFATMTEYRNHAGSIVHGNALMVFGGKGNKGFLQSTEIITENGQVSQGPPMPTALEKHAIATVNASTSIISGGEDQTNSIHFSPLTWYYNHVIQQFQAGPSLMEGRRGHTSGTIVDKKTNENIVVVAGGSSGAATKSTELLINGEWQQGKNLEKTKCICLLTSFCVYTL